MTEYVTRQKEFSIRVPNSFNPVRAWDTVFGMTLSSGQIWRNPEGRTAATEEENILGVLEEYTEEDLRIFAEEAEWTPELAERYRDFLEG